jgi:PAS domain S-box-containing protein
MKNAITPTDHERIMRDDDYIVSKSDAKGRVIYGNRIFIEFSGYTESELLGKQHNIIRHPDMPRGIFKLLWDTIQGKEECNAFLKNLSKDGGFYWVFANITPDFDSQGGIVGYTSVRRKPSAEGVKQFAEIYRKMIEIEHHTGARDACEASQRYLDDQLAQRKIGYAEFVLSLQSGITP